MIRTILVDDDHFHLEDLTKLLKTHFKQVEIIAVSSQVPDAVQQIDALKPQLVFLDIEMGQYTGFDLLEMVANRDFEVIFTTAFQQYAVNAIKASALDYLEKPIKGEDLQDALDRYKAKTGNIRMNNLLSNFQRDNDTQKIALFDKGALCFFEIHKIIRCQSENAYTEFFIADKNKKPPVIRIEVSKGLAYYEEFLLDKGCFYRVHNQHLINIRHIRKYVKDESYLVMDDQTNVPIPVARARKEDFMIFLKSKGIIF